MFGKAVDFADWWEEQLEQKAAAAAAIAAAVGGQSGVGSEAAEAEEEEGATFLMGLLRGDCGSRQDIGVEMSWRTFHNRSAYVKFLHYVKNEWKTDTKDKATLLDNSLFVQLTSPTLITADMVRAILFDKCFRPLRVLCNGVDLEDWHPLKMAGIADTLETVFVGILAEPKKLLEESFMCFDDCEVLRENQVQWDLRKDTAAIRRELYHPTDADIVKARGSDDCLGIIKAWATGILASLRRNCSDFLTSSNGRYAVANQSEPVVKMAKDAYCNNIKLGESPFAVVDHLYHAFVCNAKIGTVSGVAQAQIDNIWSRGFTWHARGSYKRDGKAIEPKGKRRKLDGQEVRILEKLGNKVRDSLVSMVGKQRKHFRKQYDGDEEKQRVARRVRRKEAGKRGREKQDKRGMLKAQYMVMERVTTKQQLGKVLEELKSAAAKEGLLKDQLNIRYLGFESAEKQPWSCAKAGRKGTWQELEPMLVAVLEAEEKGPGLTGRLRYYQ